MEYRVWTYDVWGNAKDGWEVNDRNELTGFLGSEPLDLKDSESDTSIIQALKDRGWLKKTIQSRQLDIDGDGETITINQKSDGYPLFGLEPRQV